MEIEDLVEKNDLVERAPAPPVIKRHGKMNNVKERLNQLKRGNIIKEKPKHVIDPKTKETKTIWENVTEDDGLKETETTPGWGFRKRMHNEYK